MPRLIQRHDQFFKRLLDRPGAAGALLREWLPLEITAALDEGPPEHVPGSFVGAELREYRTDRLYRLRTRTGQPCLVHCVVEHKSAPDPWIGPQLLGYKVQILEWWKRTQAHQDTASLPAVISMVVYHGRAEWRIPLSLADMVGVYPDFRPWLADFRYVLVDLGHIEDARLSRNEVLRVGFLVLKYGTRDADLRETLLALGRAALALGFDDLVAAVRYILAEPNEVEAGVLRDVLKEIMPGQEERVMSIWGEQLKAEGFTNGVVRGRAEGKAEMLLRLLRRRDQTLPPDIENRVRGASPDQLDEWSERFADGKPLAEIFGEEPLH